MPFRNVYLSSARLDANGLYLDWYKGYASGKRARKFDAHLLPGKKLLILFPTTEQGLGGELISLEDERFEFLNAPSRNPQIWLYAQEVKLIRRFLPCECYFPLYLSDCLFGRSNEGPSYSTVIWS